MRCVTCNHTNKKTDASEVHAPGKCENCNCGESEIIHPSLYNQPLAARSEMSTLDAANRLSHNMRPGTRFRSTAR